MFTRKLVLLGVLACSAPLSAQVIAPAPKPAPAATGGVRFDDTGVGDTSIFAPLELPPGNMFRSASGAPGPKYWHLSTRPLLQPERPLRIPLTLIS